MLAGRSGRASFAALVALAACSSPLPVDELVTDPAAGTEQTTDEQREGEADESATGSESLVLEPDANADSSGPEESDDLSTSSDSAPTGPEGPKPEPLLILCNGDGIQFSAFGIESRTISELTPKMDVARLAKFEIQGLFGGLRDGFHNLCGYARQRANGVSFEFVDDSYTSMIGTLDRDETKSPVIIDITKSTLPHSSAVESIPASDFGDSRPETYAAAFVPGQPGLLWHETVHGTGGCATYVSTSETLPASREGEEVSLVSEGGPCHGRQVNVVWAGNEPLVCGDMNPHCWNYWDGDVHGTATGLGVSPTEVPPSERFDTSVAFDVPQLDTTFFLGRDRMTDEWFLFRFANPGDEPELLAELGTGFFHIFEFRSEGKPDPRTR